MVDGWAALSARGDAGSIPEEIENFFSGLKQVLVSIGRWDFN